MTNSVLLLLVLSSAFAADKPSADKGDILRGLKQSHRALSLLPQDKMAASKQGRQNFLFVKENMKSIDAKEMNKMLFLRYLQEKQTAAIMKRVVIQARRYLKEKQTAAIIKQAVFQALKGSIIHQTKNKGVQKIPSNTAQSRIKLQSPYV